jgi:hypothetical protein
LIFVATQLHLNCPSQILENKISGQCRENGNGEICDCENILERKDQTFAVRAVGTLELSHQKIRIKQESYEPDFDLAPRQTGPSPRRPLMSFLRVVAVSVD